MSNLLKLVYIGLVSVSVSVLSSSIYAKNGGHHGPMGNPGGMGPGKGHMQYNVIKKSGNVFGQKYKKTQVVRSVANEKFSDKDRRIITNFFSTHRFETTGLPPGIAMNLARGKPLPPGIAKVYLPGDLNDLLVARPGYEYLVVGRDVLLVNQTDQLIVDILRNILY